MQKWKTQPEIALNSYNETPVPQSVEQRRECAFLYVFTLCLMCYFQSAPENMDLPDSLKLNTCWFQVTFGKILGEVKEQYF